MLRLEEYGGRWRIQLWQPMEPADFDQAPPFDAFVNIITVKLDRQGMLMPADEESERLIEEWERKYAFGRCAFSEDPTGGR